jgi:hypothetical protein
MKMGPAFGLALLVVAGCSKVNLVDDVDIDLDWSPLTGPSDSLHTPYVLGASFAVWAELTGNQDRNGLSIVSADPSILSIGDSVFGDKDNSLYAPAQALATGSVDILAMRGSHVEHRHTVEIMVPDRVDVLPHGPLLVDETDVPSVETPQVLVGGEATFLVQYYAGDQHLNGYGALSVTSDPASGVAPHVAKTSFLENRDWLQVEAVTEGATGTVQLAVGGRPARTIAVDVVPDDAIETVSLVGESEKHASTGKALTVLAEAFDSTGNNIYGVDYSFTANGVVQNGAGGDPAQGDLYRYRYDSQDDVTLEATHGTLSDGIMIRSSGGFVDSTNNLGCQTAPGSAPRDAGLVLLLIAGVALLSRARSANTSSRSCSPDLR